MESTGIEQAIYWGQQYRRLRGLELNNLPF